MTDITDIASRALRLAATFACLLHLSACNTEGNGQQVRADRPPAVASYRCGQAGSIKVENMGSRVRVTEAIPDSKHPEIVQREPVELGASPPEQRNRYGMEGYALVIEGREALWMRAGAVPQTCTI